MKSKINSLKIMEEKTVTYRPCKIKISCTNKCFFNFSVQMKIQ